MNLLFLILIGIPLGVYLLVMVFSTGDLSSDGMPQDSAPSEHDLPLPVAPAAAVEPAGDVANAEMESIAVAQAARTPELPIEQTRESDESEPDAVATPALTLSSQEQPALDEPTVTPTAAVEQQDTSTLDAGAVEQAADPAATEQPLAANPTVEPPKAVTEPGPSEPILSGQPLILPDKDPPKYVFDYRGRLWVEKKRRGFFRQLRRPQLPPEDPTNNTKR